MAGRAYIFNQRDFDDKIILTKRAGTDKDVTELKEVFGIFKLETTVYDDLTREGIFNEVEKITQDNFSNMLCIVIVILSHGVQYDVVSAKDASYNVDDMFLGPMLKLDKFKEIHKIFIIQACRGTNEMEKDSGQTSGIVKMNPFPYMRNVIKCSATIEGLVAYRSAQEGSFFIQCLCEELKNQATQKAKDGIDRIMMKVDRELNLKLRQIGKTIQVPSLKMSPGTDFRFGDCIDFDNRS